MDPEPTPHLEPLKYWPAPRPGDRDLGLFWNRRRRRLQVMRWFVPIVMFLVFAAAAVMVVLQEQAVAFEAFVPLLFPAVIASVVILLLRGDLGAPGGVWEVDEAGYPVRFVAPRPPPELAHDRGVTHAAYLQSVRARRVHD